MLKKHENKWICQVFSYAREITLGKYKRGIYKYIACSRPLFLGLYQSLSKQIWQYAIS